MRCIRKLPDPSPHLAGLKVGFNPARSQHGGGVVAVTFIGAVNLETSMHLLFEPTTVEGSVQRQHSDKNRSAQPTSASFMSSGTTPPTQRADVRAFPCQDRPAVSNLIQAAALSPNLNPIERLWGSSAFKLRHPIATTQVRKQFRRRHLAFSEKPSRRNGRKIPRQGVRQLPLITHGELFGF